MVSEGNTMYDNAILAKHPLYKMWKSTLNEVSNRDYPGTDYFDTRIECLDMDAYEHANARGGDAGKTADAVIGIMTRKAKQSINPRLLIVELRMNYRSTKGLHATDLMGKDSHTRDILDGHVAISPNTVFVFSDNMAGRARYWMANQIREHGEMKRFVAWSVNDFNQHILSSEAYPYKPITDLHAMVQELDEAYSLYGFEKYISTLENKLIEAVRFKSKNHNEYEAIREALKEQLKGIKALKKLSDDETLHLEILLEYFGFKF